MLLKKQYHTEEEKNNIIEENKNLILIEEQNITEGNFLIFTDTPRLEEQVANIANTVDLLLLKQEGIL